MSIRENLDTMLDAFESRGYTRVDIMLTRADRRALMDEIITSAPILGEVGRQIEAYRGHVITTIAKGDPYVVGWGPER